MDNQNVARGFKPLLKSFFSLLGQDKPKPIPPKLVQIYSYPLSAMISQLLFWHGAGSRRDGFIYKTEKGFLDELGLSSAQQKLAIKKGKDFGFLEVVRKGIPAKRHYRLNYNRLVEATIKEAERKSIVLTKGHYKIMEKRQTEIGDSKQTITYNTKENTALKHKTESINSIMERFGKKM